MNQANLRYINYARRSSDESSKKQVQSVEDQLSDTRRLAGERGLSVVRELTESRSAKEPGRPVFNEMIGKVQRGEANAILCWKLDRLTRNPIDAATLRWLMRQGKLLEIHTPHQIYRPEDNAVITAVESAMAEQYIIDLKKGVERGMKSKCEKGGVPLYAPSGYRNNKAEHTVEVDEERFALLRRAWELLLGGEHTVPQIHTILVDRWGYRGRVNKASSNGRLSLATLYNVFRNPFYKGSFTFMGTTYLHSCRRMVTRDEWELAQRLLDGRGAKQPVRYEHAFTGLMTCATCGQFITAERAKGHTYYHCSNTKGLCTKKGMREEAIAQQIDDVLESITIEPEFETFALHVLDELQQDERQRRQEIVQAQEKTLSDLKRQQEVLLELCLQNHLGMEEYAAKKQALSQQAAELQLRGKNGDKRTLNGEAIDPTTDTIKQVLHFAVQARSAFMDGAPSLKHSIAQHLGSYTFNNGVLQIELHPLFVPVREDWKKREYDIGTLEPFKTGSGKEEMAYSGTVFQAWCASVPKSRTPLQESNLVPQERHVMEFERLCEEVRGMELSYEEAFGILSLFIFMMGCRRKAEG